MNTATFSRRPCTAHGGAHDAGTLVVAVDGRLIVTAEFDGVSGRVTLPAGRMAALRGLFGLFGSLTYAAFRGVAR